MSDADSHTYDRTIVYADETPALAPPGRASRRHRLGSGLRPPSRPPRTLGFGVVVVGVVLMVLALLAVGGVVPTPGAFSPPSEYTEVVRSHPWIVSVLAFGAVVTVFVLFVSAIVALPAKGERVSREGRRSA
jgi:hypothetical protein